MSRIGPRWETIYTGHIKWMDRLFGIGHARAEWDPKNVRCYVLFWLFLEKKSCNGKGVITMDWTKTGTLALWNETKTEFETIRLRLYALFIHLIYFMPVIKFLPLYIISILKYQYRWVKSPWWAWGFNLSVPRLVTVQM